MICRYEDGIDIGTRYSNQEVSKPKTGILNRNMELCQGKNKPT